MAYRNSVTSVTVNKSLVGNFLYMKKGLIPQQYKSLLFFAETSEIISQSGIFS